MFTSGHHIWNAMKYSNHVLLRTDLRTPVRLRALAVAISFLCSTSLNRARTAKVRIFLHCFACVRSVLLVFFSVRTSLRCARTSKVHISAARRKFLSEYDSGGSFVQIRGAGKADLVRPSEALFR